MHTAADKNVMEQADSDAFDMSIVKRAYEREKLRRKKAENILEDKSRELFSSNEKLRKKNNDLQEANRRLERQKGVISGLTSQYVDVTNELKLAATIQREVLPSPLLIPSIHVSGKYLPAHYLAGDGYDYHLVDDHTFAFYVVDVAGHGAASALVSFAIHKYLNCKKGSYGNYERRKPEPLDDTVLHVMTQLNKAFCFDEVLFQYFTMVFGLLDLRKGELSFCQAGHPAPIVLNYKDQTINEHGNGGYPVGMFKESDFVVQQLQLKRKDRLIIYSDGVTDCENKDGVEYGIGRFKKDILKSSALSVIEATHYLEQVLRDWQSSDTFGDDISLLVVDYRGSSEEDTG